MKVLTSKKNSPQLDGFLAKAAKKKWKRYIPIALIAIFLIIFLISLVFEFYYAVNKNNPSISLTTEEAPLKEDTYGEKIKNFFSLGKKEKDVQAPEQEQEQPLEQEQTLEQKQEQPLEQEQEQPLEQEQTLEQEQVDDALQTQLSNVAQDSKVDIIDDNNFKNIPLNKNRHKYILQLIAVKEENFENLKKAAQILIADNHYAYIYRTPKKIKGRSGKEDYYLRLRIGFFEKKQDAVKIAHQIITKYPRIFKNYFVALPLKEEYQSKFFIFSPETQEN